jgi:hypothetical protein
LDLDQGVRSALSLVRMAEMVMALSDKP